MRGFVAISGFLLFSMGCGARERAPTIGPALATSPRPVATLESIEAEKPQDPTDIYAGVEATSVVVEGLCFLEAPGITAQVAPFDEGVGLAITSDHVDRLRADARLLAERVTSFPPPVEDERVFVAGSDDEDAPPASLTPIPVSIEVQDAPGGVMFVIVPDEPRRAGELMRRLNRDAEMLANGACPTESQESGNPALPLMEVPQ
jgi:hypothetical protein